MPANTAVQLMSKERITRSVIRMAYQIYETTHGSKNLQLIGIDDRGTQLAVLIKEQLEKILGLEVPLQKISVKKDLASSIEKSLDLRDKYVILIDDVIFSGRTIYKAIQELANNGEPKQLMITVLVDRGHRKYPLEAQFVGLESPTKLDEHVTVTFSDSGKPVEVILEKG